MLSRMFFCTGLALSLGLVFAPAQAQPRTGWLFETTGLLAFQGESDLSGGGDFSSSRAFLGAAGLYQFDSGNSAGIALSFGQQSYDFGGGAATLWDDIHGVSISAPMRFQLGQTPTCSLPHK